MQYSEDCERGVGCEAPHWMDQKVSTGRRFFVYFSGPLAAVRSKIMELLPV